jgi:hypothetical protein
MDAGARNKMPPCRLQRRPALNVMHQQLCCSACGSACSSGYADSLMLLAVALLHMGVCCSKWLQLVPQALLQQQQHMQLTLLLVFS